MALRAGQRHGLVPDGILAARIAGAGKEHLTAPRLALEQVARMALGAHYPGVDRPLQGLDEPAFGIGAAADERPVTPGPHEERRAALRTSPALHDLGGRCGLRLSVDIARIIAIRIAGAADEPAAPPEAGRHHRHKL